VKDLRFRFIKDPGVMIPRVLKSLRANQDQREARRNAFSGVKIGRDLDPEKRSFSFHSG
jgi:hypothetical protein